MRVYLPATEGDLRLLHDAGRLPAPCDGYAVTASLRSTLGDLGDEEAEYALTTAAAEASYDRLVGTGERPGRRVVVVAEVPDPDVVADEGVPGAVTVTTDLWLRQVAAVLADPARLDPTVAPPDDLAWYATQEIAGLLA